jgi:hypothetical protein
MKKTNITLSIALAAVFSSSVAFAEVEVTGKIVHESASFMRDGSAIGGDTSTTATMSRESGDLFKSDTYVKIFADGDMTDDIAYHVELNGFAGKGEGYKANKAYTQRDLLREAYIDTEISDISIRVGKQQVVWGTADGMKLLDAINPTDYTEMAQNQMEDSRIPVWMVNAEKGVGENGSFQVVLSQAKGSVFSGLGTASSKSRTNHSADNSDRGQAFKMKGVDSITGRVNGFLNIAPALGYVAKVAFGGDAIKDGSRDGVLATNYTGAGLTVWDYTNGNTSSTFGVKSWTDLCGAAEGAGGNNYVTNLCSSSADGETGKVGDEWDPKHTFEYMSATSFATFDTLGQITSQYKVSKNDSDEPNLNLRFKNSTSNGINYSLNFMSGLDTNPSVDMHWEDANGNPLYVGTTQAADTSGNASGTNVGDTGLVTTVRLYNTVSDAATDTNRFNGIDAGGYANLVFVESNKKINSFGGSMDTAVDTEVLGPIVLRSEFLYQTEVDSPIIDRKKLGHGDLAGGLTMQESDMFKYVLGVDITVLTNMLVSGQFIQERNLGFINETQVCNSEYGANCGRYTGDRAVLHLSNGLQKAEENKEFMSLFFSKPFGASGEHRWNNITMYEENDGFWNRLDAELSINDDVQATVEMNKYWGNNNTQFGQLETSSNIQVGVKYSF